MRLETWKGNLDEFVGNGGGTERLSRQRETVYFKCICAVCADE